MEKRGNRHSCYVDVEKMQNLADDAFMTWADLSRETGVSVSALRWIRSGKPCRPNTARKIAAALHVEPLELIKK